MKTNCKISLSNSVPKGVEMSAIKRSENGEDADDGVVILPLAVPRLIRQSGMFNDKVQRLHIYSNSFSLAKNAVTASATTVTLAGVEGWSSFSANYSQVTIVSVRMRHGIAVPAAGAGQGAYCACWDPHDNSVPTGFTSVATQNLCNSGITEFGPGSTVAASDPVPVSGRGGFYNTKTATAVRAFAGKLDKIDKFSHTADTTYVPWTTWMNPGSVNNIGYVKFYASNADTSSTGNYSFFYYLQITLRWRSLLG
jgi:hypothetical protein